MTSRETVERIAETIYGAMRFDRSPAAPEWVPGGNSDAQVIARQAATNIAAAILHGIAGRAEAVAEVVQSEQTGGHALHFPAGYAETLDSLPIGTKLYTHPPASAPEVTHPDDLAVDLFATAMKAMLAAAPQPEAAQPAGEAEEVGVFGERFIDGMGWAVPCSRAAPYVAAMRKAAFAMAEKEAGAYVGAGAHGIPDEPAPSAPADVEADIQKLESYLDDAGYPKDGDAQLTLESLAARLASAPQPTQRGGEGVEAVKQSLTGGGKNE